MNFQFTPRSHVSVMNKMRAGLKDINCSKELLLSGTLLGMLCGCTPMNRHHVEIPNQNLPYIAMIRTDRAESTAVVYNSEICRQIGAACGFFRSHAYAHDVLNHQVLPPDHYPDSFEKAADCWAARHADPVEVDAAIALLSDKDRYQGLPITGNLNTRAEYIRACATGETGTDKN